MQKKLQRAAQQQKTLVNIKLTDAEKCSTRETNSSNNNDNKKRRSEQEQNTVNKGSVWLGK
jgi:hypothetical protein